MYVPQVKKTTKKKKHFFQRHPTIGRFFETFGFLAWIIIFLAVASLVMFIVPTWRPTLFVILHKIGSTWNYFWGDFLHQCLSWDWSEAQPK